MSKKLYITTPFMPVLLAYTERPDKPVEGDGDPQYKIKFDPTAEDVAAIAADIRKQIGDHKFEVKSPKLGVSIAEADGKKTILAKSKYKPLIFDTANNPLQAPRIGKGTIARALCELNVWKKGVSLRLIQVQVKELVEWESKGAKSGFEETEGYVAGGSSFGDTGEDDTEEQTTGSALDI